MLSELNTNPQHAGHRKIGAVITAYKIGPVLSDTIQSVIGQININLEAVVVVVDGCPYYKTTKNICDRYARAYKDSFHYLWLDNGGVSRARNEGIKYLNGLYDDIDYYLIVDGDDLLIPNCVSTSISTIEDYNKKHSKKAGWCYFDQLQFGTKKSEIIYPKKFIASRWLASNLSQPTCIITKDMVSNNVYWDENMKLGIEDWEYWYSAIEAGYVGVANKNSYFKYRQLAGSRSSLNRKKDILTKDYMRKKHADLLSIRNLLYEEHKYFPRWAFGKNVEEGWLLGSDPEGKKKFITMCDYHNAINYRFKNNNKNGYIVDQYFPDLVALLNSEVISILNKYKLIHSVFYEAELILRKNALCYIKISDKEETNRISIYTSKEKIKIKKLRDINLLLSIQGMYEHVINNIINISANQDLVSKEVDKLIKNDITAICINVQLPKKIRFRTIKSYFHKINHQNVKDFIEDNINAIRLPAAPGKSTRVDSHLCGQDKASHYGLWRELSGQWPVLPLLKDNNKIDITILMPGDNDIPSLKELITELSDSEIKDNVRLHIVSLGTTIRSEFGQLETMVKTRTVFNIDAKAWSAAKMNYFAIPLYEKVNISSQENLVGRLLPMDVVINFCGPVISGPLLTLKKAGVVTVLSYSPSVQPDVYGYLYENITATDPYKDPMSVQAYSNAYNYINVTDNTNKTRLESYGVPSNILHVGWQFLFEHVRPELIN